MAFNQSIFGGLYGHLWKSPITGAAATFGAGSAAYAGTSTFLTTDGTFSHKSDEASSSAVKWMLGGTAAVAGLGYAATTASAFRAGWDGYQGSRPIMYGASQFAKDGSVFASKRVGSYAKDVMKEIRTPGGWKTALQRPGVSGGIGAVIGGLIGSQVSDDPGKGAAIGSVMGAGAGIAIGRVAKASAVWNKLGGVSRTGSILAASAVIGGALKLMSGPEPEVVDRPAPEDNGYGSSGVRDRMGRIGASGDLVFGLHNSR